MTLRQPATSSNTNSVFHYQTSSLGQFKAPSSVNVTNEFTSADGFSQSSKNYTMTSNASHPHYWINSNCLGGKKSKPACSFPCIIETIYLVMQPRRVILQEKREKRSLLKGHSVWLLPCLVLVSPVLWVAPVPLVRWFLQRPVRTHKG